MTPLRPLGEVRPLCDPILIAGSQTTSARPRLRLDLDGVQFRSANDRHGSDTRLRFCCPDSSRPAICKLRAACFGRTKPHGCVLRTPPRLPCRDTTSKIPALREGRWCIGRWRAGTTLVSQCEHCLGWTARFRFHTPCATSHGARGGFVARRPARSHGAQTVGVVLGLVIGPEYL
jgi:hypothetical protein